MKKVVFLTKYFPPMTEIGGKRAEKMCEGFYAKGYLPAVITLRPNNYIGKRVKGFEIEYVCGNNPIAKIGSFSKTKKKGPFGNTLKNTLLAGIMKRIETYLWPVVYVVKFFLKSSKIIIKNNPEYLFSTSPPSWIYYAALLLKLKNPKIKWIIDFRDPWFHKESNNYWGIQQEINRFIFKKTIHHADIVTATTQSCLDLIKEFMPHKNRHKLKFVFFPNGVNLSLFSEIEPQSISSINRITFGHLGDLDYSNRNPLPFLSVFDEFLNKEGESQAEVHFWGKMRASWNGRTIEKHIESLDNAGNIHFHDLVSPLEALSITIGLDVLILFALGQMYQIPAKTYEYLLSGKPILAFCEKESETFKAIEHFDGVFICDNTDPVSIEKSLVLIFNFLKINKENSRTKDCSTIDFFHYFEKFILETEHIAH